MSAMQAQQASDPRKPILFFDGACPLCSREVAHYRRMDRQSRVEWVELNSHRARLLAFGIDPQQALARIHAITPQGQVVSGVQAFVTVWRELPYYRVLAAVARWNWLMRMLDRAYDRFAAWRLRRRCAQGACPRA